MTMIVKHSGILLLLSLTFLKIPSIFAVQQVNENFFHNQREQINVEQRNNKIVGGYRCPITKFPFLVSLKHRNVRAHFCAGTLLSKFWILTASYCVANKCNLPIEVIAGSNAAWYVENDSNNSSIQFSSISRCYLDSRNRDFKFGIALARLTTPMLKTDNVGYVKLPFSLFNGDKNLKSACINTTVAGWGIQYVMDSSGYPIDPSIPEYDSHLQCVHFPIISRKECKKRIRFKLDPSIFCTYHPKRDACFGDSGGPLMCNGYQYGIVSASTGCGVKMIVSIFINISHFREFILTTLASSHDLKSIANTINCAMKSSAVLVIIVFSKLYIC